METNMTELVALAHEIGRRLHSPNIDGTHTHCPRVHLYLGNPAPPFSDCCYLTVRQERGRIEVSGNFHFPSRKGGTSYMPPSGQSKEIYRSITIAATKTPDQIATDIKRRFLPGYLSAWEDAAKRLAQCNAHDDHCLRTKEILAQAAGDTLSDRQRVETQHEVTLYTKVNGEAVRLSCQVWGDKATLNIGTAQPLDIIVRMIEILKGL